MSIPRQEISSLFKDSQNYDEISSSRGKVNSTGSNDAPPPEMLTASSQIVPYQIKVGNPETRAVGECGETKRSYCKFSKLQISILEEFFQRNAHPNSIQKKHLSDITGVDLVRVNNWFLNRSIKQKRLLEKKMEECETKNYKLRIERMKINQALSPCTCEEMLTDELKERNKLKEEVKLMAEAFQEQLYDNPQMITQNEEVQNQTTDKPKKTKRNSQYSKFQINILERIFKDKPRLIPVQREQLGYALEIDSKKLNYWFQKKKSERKRQFELETMEKLEAENKKLSTENFKLMKSIPASTCEVCGGYIDGGAQETQ